MASLTEGGTSPPATSEPEPPLPFSISAGFETGFWLKSAFGCFDFLYSIAFAKASFTGSELAGGSSPSDEVLSEGSNGLDSLRDAEILMGLVLGFVGIAREETGVLEEEMPLRELRERRNEG